jgi:hypothetical protein
MHASNHSVVVRSISDRKRLANQRNAEKSTGPRSEEGKKRSSMNGVSHGVFCQDLLLPGEDVDELKRFRDALLIDLNPVGMVQQAIAERIVSCLWRLRRLGGAERTMQAQIEAMIEKAYAGKPAAELHAAAYAKLFSVESERFRRLGAYEQWLTNTVLKCSKELRLLRKEADKVEASDATDDARIENEPTETSTEPVDVQPDGTACNLTQPGATEQAKTEKEPTEGAEPRPGNVDSPRSTTARSLTAG